MKPEEGMEVFAQGKLTTYAKGSISNYQLQVDQIDAQGEGALLKIFEQRKKKLKEEGLFDDQYKKKLPFLPKKLESSHLLQEPSLWTLWIVSKIDFSTHLELFPISVQGAKSAEEIIFRS